MHFDLKFLMFFADILKSKTLTEQL